MPGDHSPFLSRPAELARTLVGCLDDRGDGGRADRLAD
jgi:hypothetical protein